MVIGIQAPWGDGKSTLKNMVVDLEKSEPPPNRLLFVHFNPWEWAGQNQVAEAFFQELDLQLDVKGTKAAAARHTRTVRETLGKFSTSLGIGKVIAQGVSLAAAPFNPAVAATVQVVAKSLGKAEQATLDLERVSKKPEPYSAEKVKEEVRSAFLKFREETHLNIVVLIDDIDRLSADEIRQVLQLVKINADFPGFIFVLLYDKAYVERRLRQHFDDDSRSFLEKIVQVELHLPPAAPNAILKCLMDNIHRALQTRPAYLNLYEKPRLKQVFDVWLGRHLSNLRRLGRLMSSWSFRLDVFNSAVPEVNPVDLLILEGLSLYEPAVYRALSLAFEDLFPSDYGLISDMMIWSHERPAGKPSLRMQALNRIAQAGGTGEAEPAVAALKVLFGVTDTDFGDVPWEEEARRLRALRFCCPQFFRRYFRLTIDSGEISNATIVELVQLIETPANFVLRLTKLEESGVLIDALDQLLAQDLVLPSDPAPLLAHILDWWEVRIKSGTNSSDLSNLKYRLINFYQFLLGSREGATRFKTIKSALRQCTAVYAAVDIAFHESIALHLYQEGKAPKDKTLSQEDDLVLRELAAKRYYQAVKKLKPKAHPWEIEACYWTWNHGGRWREQVGRELLKTPESILTLLLATVGKIGESLTEGALRQIPGLMAPIVTFEELVQAVKTRRQDLITLEPQRVPQLLGILGHINSAAKSTSTVGVPPSPDPTSTGSDA